MYSYGMIFETADLNTEALATATKEELSQSLQVALKEVKDRVVERMKSFEGGGWEIISHQLTRLDRYLVASFLLRRQK